MRFEPLRFVRIDPCAVLHLLFKLIVQHGGQLVLFKLVVCQGGQLVLFVVDDVAAGIIDEEYDAGRGRSWAGRCKILDPLVTLLNTHAYRQRQREREQEIARGIVCVCV
jgi:hypothetical protein